MWRSRRIRQLCQRQYRRPDASYHANIIKLSLFGGTLSPGYARIIKKQVGSRQGAARDKNGKPELAKKTRAPPGARSCR
ncbi:hypothetical protein CQJ27_08560 [Escherichia sp. E1130]|nr:hypothetical protein CQJ27_08560 [Escherichia sp. E1130]